MDADTCSNGRASVRARIRTRMQKDCLHSAPITKQCWSASVHSSCWSMQYIRYIRNGTKGCVTHALKTHGKFCVGRKKRSPCYHPGPRHQAVSGRELSGPRDRLQKRDSVHSRWNGCRSDSGRWMKTLHISCKRPSNLHYSTNARPTMGCNSTPCVL